MQESEITSELLERYLNLSDDELIDQLTEIFVRDFENNLPDMEIIIGSSDLQNSNIKSTYFISKLQDKYVVWYGGEILATDISAFLLLRRFCRFKKLYHNDRITCKFK